MYSLWMLIVAYYVAAPGNPLGALAVDVGTWMALIVAALLWTAPVAGGLTRMIRP